MFSYWTTEPSHSTFRPRSSEYVREGDCIHTGKKQRGKDGDIPLEIEGS